MGMGLDFNVIVPLLPFCCGFFFVLGYGISFFFNGFQHPSFDACPAASCDFLTEEVSQKMSTLPSTLLVWRPHHVNG